ncbi:atp-binding cassette g family transporter abcg107 [Cystoisospora suis]|uniref:Atp-binding cassette g family transporter abcg107 n=1 Tax=Cystoisospora suis TaxID=483139 RepID=A0A2C6L9Q3_9APIC|nr:atp-binding cassette g family transporter abcg107 [Cystoisospora suis]
MASPMARQPPVPATSKGLLLSASSSSPPNEPGDSTRKDGGVPETPTKKKSKIHHMGRGELLNEKLQHVTTPREPIQDEGFFSGDVGERREVEQPRLSPQQLHASVCKKPITLIARNFSYAVRLKVPCIPRDCCCRGGSRRGMNVKETTKGRRASSLGSHPTTPSQRSPGGQEKRYDCLPSENHHKGDPQGELGELQQPSLDGIGLLDRDGKGENKETEESRKASTTKKGEKKEGHLEDLEAGRNRSHYGGESDVETSQRQGNGKEEGYERDSDEDRGKEGGQLLGGGLSSNEGGQFDTKERARVHETSGGEGQVKAILSDIDLYAKPGEMLVIMGPSGSGKTTLLNALAGRSLPSSRVVQNGDILYLGLPPGETLSNISTYVMQKDKVPELLTVHEYITFFSKLKMKDSTDEERAARVEVVLKELGLWRSRHTRVGGSAQKGLSGGEIKRLALAVELLHDPSLIFLGKRLSPCCMEELQSPSLLRVSFPDHDVCVYVGETRVSGVV